MILKIRRVLVKSGCDGPVAPVLDVVQIGISRKVILSVTNADSVHLAAVPLNRPMTPFPAGVEAEPPHGDRAAQRMDVAGAAAIHGDLSCGEAQLRSDG